MNDSRTEVLDWVARGLLPRERVAEALLFAGVTPSATQWRAFLDRLLLWTGIAALAAAMVFFVAANWDALGRFGKLALVEGAIVLALAICVWRGLDTLAGRASLVAAALLAGALLALVGQVYQTGADTFELFAVWAVAIFAWVVLGCQPALWVIWLVLVNVAIALYYATFGGFLGVLFSPPAALWLLFIVDTAALFVWETLSRRGVAWLEVRWAPRALAVASGAAITCLALWSIFDHWRSDGWYLLPYALWVAAMYWFYRVRSVDLFNLAGAVLSVVVVISLGLGRALSGMHSAGGFLFIGLVLIASAAAGAFWLRQVAAEERT
jgi:uncharacterized membrane protein